MAEELGLTEAEVAQFQKAFDMFDGDNDGIITVEDLDMVMKKLKIAMSRKEIEDMVAIVDADGNGQVEFDEFLIMMKSKMDSGDSQEELVDAFKVFDEDGTGFVVASELRRLVTTKGDKMTEAEAEEMIRVSMATDDKIDYMRFANILIPN